MVQPSASAAGGGVVSADQCWRLLQSAPLGLLVVGRDGGARLINREGARLLGVRAAEVVGRRWRQPPEIADAATGERFDGLPAGAGRDRAPARYRIVAPDGSQRVIEVSRAEPSTGWPASWETVLWLRDCTDDDAQLRRLSRLAARDDLTNLVNRREFERRLANALDGAKRDGSRHVLMFMDLDRFKQINDRFGHPAGDAVLRQVAETLRRTVRERDTLGRLGGDEFGLLMERCDLDEGRRAAAMLQRRLSGRRWRWDGQALTLGISIGLAAVDADCADIETAWQQADAACYRAKRALARRRA